MADFVIRPTADGNFSNATFHSGTTPVTASGLANGTEYEAFVLSSASTAFTPVSAGGGSSIALVNSGDLGSNASDTLTSAITSTGFWVLVLATDDASASAATVTFNGVSATLAVNSAEGTGGNTEVHYLEAATVGNIAITHNGATRAKSYSLFKLTGFTATGSGSVLRVGGTGTITLSSVPDGAAIIAASTGAGATGITVTATDTTEAVEVTSTAHHTVNTGEKSGVGDVSISTVGDGVRESFVGVYFPAV